MLPQNTVEILKTLNKTELKSLGDFIYSPYFNSIEKLKDLYNEIMKTYPDLESRRLEDETLHKKLYPGKEFKQKAILNLFSDFGNLLKKFLSYEKFGAEEDAMDLRLAESLSQKKCYELSKKVINDYKKRKKTSGKFSEDYFSYLYKMEKIYYSNIIHSRPIHKQDIYDSLNSRSQALMLDFLNKYSSLAHTLSLTSMVRPDEENNKKIEKFFSALNIDKLPEYVESTEDKFLPIVTMQYLLYHYIKAEMSEEQYYKLKNILIKNVENLSSEDICIYFKAILDMGILKNNVVDVEEMFDLRKLFCDLKINPNDSIPKFSTAALQNTLICAMMLGKFEWAENFLEEYINYIDDDLRENEYNYSKGLLYFKLKKYEDSLQYLNKVKYSELLEKLNVRFYYVMNYIELKLYDAAASMVKSIKQLQRESKEIPVITFDSITNCLKFFNEIIKCGESSSKLDIAVLKEAQTSRGYFHKPYIVEKLKTMV